MKHLKLDVLTVAIQTVAFIQKVILKGLEVSELIHLEMQFTKSTLNLNEIITQYS